MILQSWNPAYHLTTAIVEEGPVPAFHPGVHTHLNRFLYAEDQGIERLDCPILAKLKRKHFTVTGADTVDPESLHLPSSDIADMNIDPPERCHILIARKDNAPMIAELMQVRGELDC